MLVRELRESRGAARDTEYAKALGCQRGNVLDQASVLGRRKAAKVGDSFRRPLGGDDGLKCAVVPHMGDREHARAERVFAGKRPFRMQVLTPIEQPGPRGVQRPLHGVERIALACQDRVLEQFA